MPSAVALLIAVTLQDGAPAPAPAPAAPATAEPHRKSLLVITLDTARRDFIGFMGRSPSPTPNLDRLAQESIVFDDAYTVAPLTLPAHTSLFTGLYPRAHGVHENSTFKVPQSALTLAELLQSHGYATAATVAAFVLDPMFGLDQGFASYDATDVVGAGRALLTQRPAGVVVGHALEDLAKLAQKRPFFCWVHLYDPHFPYLPPAAAVPPSFLVDPDRYGRAMYEEEIRYADGQIGRLFAALREQGLEDEVVVLFASDHGESLNDAPEPTHGYFLHDSTVRIPMLLHCPGLAPRRVATQVSLIDVMPTLLDLLGIEAPELRFDGLDLAPLLRDPAAEPPERALLFESWYAWLNFGWAPFDGCVQGALKHLRSHRLELFDRAADPDERVNLFDPDEPRSRLLARRLDELMHHPATRLERDAISLTGRDLSRLLQMGYATATAQLDDPPDATTLPDVYEKVEVIRALEDVIQAGALGDKEGEMRLMRGLVEREPKSASLQERLGILLANAGPASFDEAETHLRAALRIEPKSSRSYNALGRIAATRATQAREEIKRRRDAGEEREALRDLFTEERVQTRRAIRSYRTAIEFEPNLPDAIERLARILGEEAERDARAENVEEARKGFEEALGLLDRWLGFMPPNHSQRAQVEENRAWVARQIEALGKPR